MEKLIPVVVQRKWDTAAGIVGLEVVSARGGQLPAFSPGAHVDVHLHGAGQRERLVRQYSLCNAPGETHRYVLGVKLEPESRGGSRTVHQVLRVGDALEISAPRNLFPLGDSASQSVLIAAGIGITPLLAMALHLNRHGGRFTLHYFVRSAGHVAFRERLAGLEQADALRVHTGLSPSESDRAVQEAIRGIARDARIYACGPAPFMDMVGRHALTVVDADRFHMEHFGSKPAEAAMNTAFDVIAQRSGVNVRVPAHLSIVEALRTCGVDIDVSCEQGVCGTCLTRVIAGAIDHRDVYLSEAEKRAGDQMTPCCSRALGPSIVLDI